MTEKSDTLTCNFCGKTRNSVTKMIAGPGVYICNECIELSYQILKQDVNEKSTQDKLNLENIPYPTDMKLIFDEYIIGHSFVKEVLSVSAYNHYKRINTKSDVEIEKSNILLLGPTGSGKTLFAKTLSKILHVPFIVADATSLTEAGYVGDDSNSLIEQLIREANYDLEFAQQGIVFIDEIDKKAKRHDSSSNARDVSGEGVQQSLLRLIEGSSVPVKIPSRKYGDEIVEFDTRNVIFILSGAFVGLDKIISQRSEASTIGFGSKIATKTSSVQNVTSSDLINYGLIPELVGRIPIICPMDKLTEKQLVYVMSEVKNNLFDQYKELLKMDDIELEFSDNYAADVASLAIQQDIGARAIKQIIENSLLNIMFRIKEFQETNVKKIVLTKYPSRKENYPELYYKNNTKEKDKNYKLYRGSNAETPL